MLLAYLERHWKERLINSLTERRQAGGAVRRKLRDIILWFSVAIVCIAPVPLGSNREFAWFPLSLALVALCAGAFVFTWPRWHTLFRRDRLVLPIVLLLALPVTWAFLQPHVTMTLPLSHAWWSPLEQYGIVSPGSLVVSPELAAYFGSRLAGYFLCFMIFLMLGLRQGVPSGVVQVLAVAFVFYALFGIVSFIAAPDMIGFIEPKSSYKFTATGTFVNQNHFAAQCGLGAVLNFALAVRAVSQWKASLRSDPSARDRLGRWLPWMGVLVCLVALTATGSRAGFAASFTGLSVAGVALVAAGYLSRRKALVAAIALALLAVVVTLGNSHILGRIAAVETDLGSRTEIMAVALQASMENPLYGIGAGNFQSYFEVHGDERFDKRFRQAHNSYVENLAELGWPATIAGMVGLALIALRLAGRLQQRPKASVVACAVLGAVAQMAAHSLVDFPLQIPALALAFAALLGVGLAWSVSRHHL